MESYLYLRFCFIMVCLFKKKKKKRGEKKHLLFCEGEERGTKIQYIFPFVYM